MTTSPGTTVRPFTADDVVFTFELFQAAPTGRWTHHVSNTPNVERAEVFDEGTVPFTCAPPARSSAR